MLNFQLHTLVRFRNILKADYNTNTDILILSFFLLGALVPKRARTPTTGYEDSA